MGKRNRKRVKNMKSSNKSASYQGSTAAPSTSSTVEVGADEKERAKCNQTSSAKSQAGNFPEIVTAEMDEKEKRNRPNEGIKVEEQSSHLKESEMTDKEITEVLEAIEECITVNKRVLPLKLKLMGNVSAAHYQNEYNSLAERRRDLYTFLKAKNPELFENVERRILKKEQKSTLRPTVTVGSSNKTSEIDKLHVLEYNPEKRMDIIDVTDKIKRKVTDCSEMKDSNEGSNQFEKKYLSIEFWFKKFRCSFKPFLASIRSEAFIDMDKRMGIEGAIDLLHQYRDLTYEEIKENRASHEQIKEFEELVDEINDSIIELRNVLDEMPCSSTDYIEVTEEPLQIEIGEEIKSKENIDRSIDEIKDFHSDKERVTTVKPTKVCGRKYSNDQIKCPEKEREDIIASKNKADQVNDLIIELGKVEAKKYGSYTDYVKVTEDPLQNATEDKVKNKGKEDTGRSNDGVQDSHSEKEALTLVRQTEDCDRKNSKDRAIHPEKKSLKVIDFKRDSEEFMTLQNSSLDKRAKKRAKGTEHKLAKEQSDLFSSEKRPITAIKKTESHEKSEETTDLESKESANETISTLNDEPKEVVIELEKEDDIYYEIETDGNKHIYVGSNYNHYHIKNKQGITFNFKKEGVRISFTGYRIFVSTQMSEFDIFVRNSKPFHSNDEATQTDNLP